jgi:hypothetical protein
MLVDDEFGLLSVEYGCAMLHCRLWRATRLKQIKNEQALEARLKSESHETAKIWKDWKKEIDRRAPLALKYGSACFFSLMSSKMLRRSFRRGEPECLYKDLQNSNLDRQRSSMSANLTYTAIIQEVLSLLTGEGHGNILGLEQYGGGRKEGPRT